MVTSAVSGVARWPISHADVARPRRRPARSARCWSWRDSAGALLGQRGALGGRARSALRSASMRRWRDLRVERRARRSRWAMMPLGEAFDLGAAGEQSGAAVLDLALGAGALGGEPRRRGGSRLRRAAPGRRRAPRWRSSEAMAAARLALLARRARRPPRSAELDRELLLPGELIVLRGRARRAGGASPPLPCASARVTSGAPAATCMPSRTWIARISPGALG